MTHRLVLAVTTATLLCFALCGCQCTDRYYHGHCPSRSLSGRYNEGCADGACGASGYTPGVYSEGDCASGACADGGCASGSCGRGRHGGPFRALWNALSCSSGCGEFYFDEWINDPPDRCDPCDDFGGYVGPRGDCKQRRSLSVRGGGHCGQACGGGCADGACGGADCGCGSATIMSDDPEVMEPTPLQPTPALEARRPAKPYYTPSPQRVTASPAPRQRVISTSTRNNNYQTPQPAMRR